MCSADAGLLSKPTQGKKYLVLVMRSPLVKEMIDSTIASLLRGTILLDTVNLSDEAKRVTPIDKEMVLWLEEFPGNEEGRDLEIC